MLYVNHTTIKSLTVYMTCHSWFSINLVQTLSYLERGASSEKRSPSGSQYTNLWKFSWLVIICEASAKWRSFYSWIGGPWWHKKNWLSKPCGASQQAMFLHGFCVTSCPQVPTVSLCPLMRWKHKVK